jgi:hypothetical protein
VPARLRARRGAEEREEDRVILREVQAIAEMVRLENEEEERQKEKEKEEEDQRQCEAQAAAEQAEGVAADAAVSPTDQEMDTSDQECQTQGQKGRKRKRDVAEDVAHPSEPPQKTWEEDSEMTEADVQALVGLARAALVVDRHQSCSGEQ